MAREAKFNFIPAHLASTVIVGDRELAVTLYTKPQKAIAFPIHHPETRQLVGKYLQFFVDSGKNVLGWKVFDKGELADLKNAVQVVEYKSKTSTSVKCSASLPMKNLDFMEGHTYKKLKVAKYKEQGMLNDGKTIYYIEIEKPDRKAKQNNG